MKKIFINCFFVLVLLFAFSKNVNAEEITESDVLEDYEINALAASESEDGKNYIDFSERFNSFYYSPVMNYFFESNGLKLSYSGANYMLSFKDFFRNTNFYTGGNLIYKNYSDNYYPVHDEMYFIDNDGILFINTGILDLGYTPGATIVNCVHSDDYMTATEAARFCFNNSDQLINPDFLESNNLQNRYIYNSWTVDGEFNPWVDGSKYRSEYDTFFEPSEISIPSDASGCYIDYLQADSFFNNFYMKRCYYGGLKGSFTLNEFKDYITNGNSSLNNNILIIGVGSFWCDDILNRGFMQAPNLEEYNINAWSYVRIEWSHYNSQTSFNSDTCSSEFVGTYHINATTDGKDIEDNTSDKEPNLGFFEGIFQKLGIDGFGQVFKFLDNYIKSMTTNINEFSEMINVVFQWLPEPVLNLLIFALIAFIAILLIKLLLHLL